MATAASALQTKEETQRRACRWVAATLASASTSLLALQSTAVSRVPSAFFTSPMALRDLCAGARTSLPLVTIVEMSSPTVRATLCKILARGLAWWVALAVPAAAVVTRAWQSVRMAGTKGQCSSIAWRAQASAEAAVPHQEGGHPRPYTSKSPAARRLRCQIAQPECLPLAIQEGAVAVPSCAGQSRVVVVAARLPLEGASLGESRNADLQGEEAMLQELLAPLRGELGHGEGCNGRREREAGLPLRA